MSADLSSCFVCRRAPLSRCVCPFPSSLVTCRWCSGSGSLPPGWFPSVPVASGCPACGGSGLAPAGGPAAGAPRVAGWVRLSPPSPSLRRFVRGCLWLALFALGCAVLFGLLFVWVGWLAGV